MEEGLDVEVGPLSPTKRNKKGQVIKNKQKLLLCIISETI